MAFSLPKAVLCVVASWLASQAAAAPVTHTFDWNITWVTRNPDGQMDRPVIGINNQWPIPTLNVTKGDRVVVNMNNQLGNQSTSLHFHGLFQNGTNEMDGPVGVTQCNVAPGSSFVYNFTVDQPGIYWYHSHSRGQYPDGLRGQFLVHDPENPYADMIDEEVAITVSDWYHDQMPGLLDFFISVYNPTGAEPVPNAALLNETQNTTFAVQPGKNYFFRMSNIAAFAGMYFWIEGHNLTIIEVDGVYHEPAEAEMIYITAAQRYGFIVKTRNDTSANFPMVTSMDTDLFDAIPDGLNVNATGWLVYDQAQPMPDAAILDDFDAQFDDFDLVPQDGMKLLENPDMSFNLDLAMDNLGDGANYAFFNGITYVRPKVPTLYTALTTGNYSMDPTVYGRDTNSYVLPHNQVIEIILNNQDTGKHPFHLHGHNYQVLWRSPDDYGDFDPNNHTTFREVPMRRDTFWVRPTGNFVIRFRADNPGIWLFHCHLEWHLASGLVATMVEAPLEIQKTITVPQNHYDACAAGLPTPVPTAGNAAANTKDFLDLTGQYMSVPPLPSGFTAKGIVALVFSCIAAFLGMAVIAWYGAAPITSTDMQQTRNFVKQAGGSTT